MKTDPIVVFLVLSHHKPNLVERLVARLSETRSAVTVVHHDAKAAAEPSLPADARALFVPKPYSVGWGDLTLVTTTLRCMWWIREEISDVSWIVLISGQDYPAMSPRSLEAELLESDADAFIGWDYIPPVARRSSTDWQRHASRRYYWHRVPGHSRAVPVPRLRFFFDGIGLFAGSQWWNLGRNAIDRVLDDAARSEYLLRRLRSPRVPDEAFFQTVLLNNARGLRLVNSHRRFYRFAVGSPHPRTLTISDLDEILASRAFFARKVDNAISEELLDRLDAQTSAT
jgi:hypothetical protein